MRMLARFTILLSTALVLNADPERPRAFVDVRFQSQKGRTSLIRSGQDLQIALDGAQPGDTLLLEAGATFSGNFVLRPKTGTGRIVIASSTLATTLPRSGTRIGPEHSPLLAKIVSPNADPALQFGNRANHYRIVGIEIALDPSWNVNYNLVLVGSSLTQTTPADAPTDVIFDRVYIHGYRNQETRRGIALNCASCGVIDSYISEIHQSFADSQAICAWNGPGPYHIENNYLSAAGENVMFGGAAALGPDMNPGDIIIRHNYMVKPLRWRWDLPGFEEGDGWSVKNVLELKNASRAVIEYNVLENSWIASQNGYCIVLNPIADSGPTAAIQDIMFRYNLGRGCSSGLNIAAPWVPPLSPQPIPATLARVAFQDNLIHDIEYWPIGLLGCPNCSIEHNTFVQLPTSRLAVAMDGKANDNLVLRDNIFTRHGAYGVAGGNTGGGLAAFQMYAPPESTIGLRILGNLLVNDLLLPNSELPIYPSGNYILNGESDLAFVNPALENYELGTLSPWKRRGNAGRDPGADIGKILAGRNIALSGSNVQGAYSLPCCH
jgi:hypothetical protein